jgi:hypothetical protein
MTGKADNMHSCVRGSAMRFSGGLLACLRGLALAVAASVLPAGPAAGPSPQGLPVSQSHNRF